MDILDYIFDFFIHHTVCLNSGLALEFFRLEHNGKKRSTSTANILNLKIGWRELFRQSSDNLVLLFSRRRCIVPR